MPDRILREAFSPLYTLARYPGWLEVLIGIVGGTLWTVVTLFANVGIVERPGLYFVTYYMPGLWEVAGVALATFHGYALASGSRKGRAWAVFFTTIFWAQITYGVLLTSWFRGTPIPITVVASTLVVVICFFLTVRLWKGYS